MWHRASSLAHASCVAQTVAPLYHVPVGACAAACGVLAVEPDGDLCVPLDPSVFDVLSELAPAFIRCVMDVMPDLDQVVVRSSRVDCLVTSHLQRSRGSRLGLNGPRGPWQGLADRDRAARVCDGHDGDVGLSNAIQARISARIIPRGRVEHGD